MRPLSLLAGSALFFFLLAGCVPSTVNTITKKPGTELLPPLEILKLVEGNTLFLHSPEEDSYLFFDTSGKIFGRDIYTNRDTGKWDVSDDGMVCLKMRKWWYGDLKCYSVYSNANKKRYFLANSSGVLEYSAEHFAGDTEKLFTATKPKRKSYRKSIRNQQAPAPEEEPDDQHSTSFNVDQEKDGYNDGVKKDVQTSVKWIAKDCPGCNLADADLRQADLIGAQLEDADLSRADLHMANLRRANLRNANLKNASLRYANMPGANLRDANLSNADFTGANLIRADLTGADVTGANLTGALLEGTSGLQK